MLPIHRTMKKNSNSRGDFYSDDKYDKADSTKGFRFFRKVNRKALLSIGIISLGTLYILYNRRTASTSKSTIPSSHIPAQDPLDLPLFQPFDDTNKVDSSAANLDLDSSLVEDVFGGTLPNELDSTDLAEQEDTATFSKHQQKPFYESKHQQPLLFVQSPPPESLTPVDDDLTAYRQQKIVDAFQHAWKGYKTDAFGKDEYQPLTHAGHSWAPGGIGLMIIDSLDTMMLMNLTEEYEEARSWIVNHLDFEKHQDVNVFETTIRVLGGLLAAYHLSGNDPVYLEKAIDLGDRLLPAFNSGSGVPFSGVFLSSGRPKSFGPSSTAEATTVQMEFKYLSHLTGDMKYWKAAERVMDRVHELVHTEGSGALDGLVPIFIDPGSGQFASKEIRLGSRGDSYYEYLLKLYLQTDKTELRYRERYDHALRGVKKHLVQYSYPNHYMYIAELLDSSNPTALHPKMDHLVCFLGGSFVLGVSEGAPLDQLDPLDPKDSEDLRLGEELTRTCYEMYRMTATGLASEIVYFNNKQDSKKDEPDMEIHLRDRHNLLRPETVESLFLLYRLTGDNKYREWGWNIFEAFEKYTKLPEGGYAALKDVTVIPPPTDNRMDTFFMAETLKYLYLLFSPDDVVPLENYVFNTEGHPLPVFSPRTKQ